MSTHADGGRRADCRGRRAHYRGRRAQDHGRPAHYRAVLLLVAAALALPLVPAGAADAGIAGGQEVTRRVLEDGVVVWERSDGDDQPRFFRLLGDLYDLVIPSGKALPFDRSVALLVGVSRYQHIQPQLPFVRNDLRDMREYLLGPGGFDAVFVAADDVPGPALVEGYMLNRFRRELGPRDRLLFYYAGHADDLAGTTGYIQFSRAEPDDFAQHTLAINRAEEWSRVIKAGHILFVFDACASGLAFAPRSGGSDDAVALLSTLNGNGSRTVITAGTAEQRTYEVESGSGQGNGVFTRALLDALGDQAKEPFVTITEAFGNAQKRVGVFASRYGKALTPRIWTLQESQYRGTFLFVNSRGGDLELPDQYREALGLRARGTEAAPGAGAPPAPAGPFRTPWLGLQFVQDGQTVVFRMDSTDYPFVADVTLRPAPFRILVPRQDLSIGVVAWLDRDIFSLVPQGPEVIYDSLFGPGTGMAATNYPEPELVIHGEAMNYYTPGDRMEPYSSDFWAITVARFREHWDYSGDLIQLADLQQPVYLVAWRDTNGSRAPDHGEIDRIVLRFSP